MAKTACDCDRDPIPCFDCSQRASAERLAELDRRYPGRRDGKGIAADEARLRAAGLPPLRTRAELAAQKNSPKIKMPGAIRRRAAPGHHSEGFSPWQKKK